MSIKLPCDKCIHNKVCTTRGGSNQDGVCKYFDEEEPKIDVFCENADDKTKEELKADLKAILDEIRPTGEWIDHSDDEGYVECPFCEHLTNCEGNIDELHYCWNCGAKLGKGGAERINKETTFDDFLNEQLKDPEFKKEWDKLCDEDMRGDNNGN